MSEAPVHDDPATRAVLRSLSDRKGQGWSILWAGLVISPLAAWIIEQLLFDGFATTGLAALRWLGWTLGILVPFVVVASMIWKEESERQARVTPVLHRGQRQRGEVRAVTRAERSGDVVQHAGLDVAVILEDGREVTATFRQMERRAVVAPSVGALAMVWALDDRMVIAVGGLVFEA